MPDFSKHRTRTNKLIKKVGSRAVNFQAQSTRHVTRYVTKRTERIVGVRRFIAGWLFLAFFLCIATIGALVQVSRLARVDTAVSGGTYTEGVVGSINNLNPLFTAGSIDESSAKLLFNGLLRYDTNGVLVPDVATDWQVDDSRKVYIVNLRKDVRWHDGQPLTAQDVVYTIGAIQDTETRSTLYANWQGVKASAPSDFQVRLELTAPTASFPTSLTLPILPKHILGDVPANKLRTVSFNTSPIGTGPFVFSALRNEGSKEQQVELKKNVAYYRGTPKLDRFVIHTFEDDESLARALENREITAAVDLKSETIENFSKDTSIRPVDIPLNSGVFAFFKTTSPILSDTNVRTALAESVDRQAILQLFKARYAPLKTPLLPSQLGYDATYAQQTNLADAAQKLDEAGWVKQPSGVRAKDGQPLEIGLTTANSAQYSALESVLQQQWASIGVTIKPQLLAPEQLQQTALSAHAYDILLYGISIGYDPDVYAYWHSSQARVGGLNFSEWKSSRADSSLEVARTRLDPVLRTARYKTFLDEWRKSSPAVALYQPRTNYAYHQNAVGFKEFPATSAAERLTNVEDWMVNTKSVDQTP